MNKNLFLYYFILTIISTQINMEIALRDFLNITGLLALFIFIGSWLGSRSKKNKEPQSASEV